MPIKCSNTDCAYSYLNKCQAKSITINNRGFCTSEIQNYELVMCPKCKGINPKDGSICPKCYCFHNIKKIFVIINENGKLEKKYLTDQGLSTIAG